MRDIPTTDLILRLAALHGYKVKMIYLDYEGLRYDIKGFKVNAKDLKTDKFMMLPDNTPVYVVSKGLRMSKIVVIDDKFDHFSSPRQEIEPRETTINLSDEMAMAKELNRRIKLNGKNKTGY